MTCPVCLATSQTNRVLHISTDCPVYGWYRPGAENWRFIPSAVIGAFGDLVADVYAGRETDPYAVSVVTMFTLGVSPKDCIKLAFGEVKGIGDERSLPF